MMMIVMIVTAGAENRLRGGGRVRDDDRDGRDRRSRNRLRGGGVFSDDDRDGRDRRSRNRLRDGDRVRGDAHEQAFS